MNKMQIGCIIILLALVNLSFITPPSHADTFDPQTTITIEAIPESSEVFSFSDFIITIRVDPNWETIDTVTTDYLFWSPGMMELVGVEKGNLFDGTTMDIGVTPITPLPSSAVPLDSSKTWNMSLPAPISQLGGDKTGIVFHAQDPSGWGAPPWTKYINYTITVNGVVVEDDVFTATWDGGGYGINTSYQSYLEDWITAGISTSDEYLDITLSVSSSGADTIGIKETNKFSTDSHKRYLLWAYQSGTFRPGDFMNLTFTPLNTGTVTFNMSGIIIASGGIGYSFNSINCTVDILEATASIKLNQTTWITNSVLGGNETKSFNLENDGNIAVDIDIKASNTEDWMISNNAGHNLFALYFNNSGGPLGDIEIKNTDTLFYEALAKEQDIDFVLTLFLPVTSTVSRPQEVLITLTATVQ